MKFEFDYQLLQNIQVVQTSVFRYVLKGNMTDACSKKSINE
ncbi:unnamed protein product [Paramecium sonneborni]|uniref:Uncharacterized protein n=1 Tax=Paramecium sonneborni TaxID=65129 RepID=A0A8S1RNT2_9CILI|nr:unnamed protein product [Paramecium sonneborni]